MEMPVDIKAVLDAAKKVEGARDIPVNAVILVDSTAPQDLIGAVAVAFELLSETSSVRYYGLGRLEFNDEIDFCCIVAGSDPRIGAAAATAREAGVPVMVVASSPDYVKTLAIENGYAIPSGDVIDGSSVKQVGALMGAWVLAACKNKKLAAAESFACVRRPLAEESIKATSIQNAGVGVVAIIPGADMPIMTLNQIKMLLQIAGAFGQPMDAGRIKELAVVVGGGFLARTVARQLVGLVPVGGWIIKGGIGYSATMAMGYAALNYFEGGGGLSGVGAVANAAAESAVHGKVTRSVKSVLTSGAHKVTGAVSGVASRAIALREH